MSHSSTPLGLHAPSAAAAPHAPGWCLRRCAPRWSSSNRLQQQRMRIAFVNIQQNSIQEVFCALLAKLRTYQPPTHYPCWVHHLPFPDTFHPSGSHKATRRSSKDFGRTRTPPKSAAASMTSTGQRLPRFIKILANSWCEAAAMQPLTRGDSSGSLGNKDFSMDVIQFFLFSLGKDPFSRVVLWGDVVNSLLRCTILLFGGYVAKSSRKE